MMSYTMGIRIAKRRTNDLMVFEEGGLNNLEDEATKYKIYILTSQVKVTYYKYYSQEEIKTEDLGQSF